MHDILSPTLHILRSPRLPFPPFHISHDKYHPSFINHICAHHLLSVRLLGLTDDPIFLSISITTPSSPFTSHPTQHDPQHLLTSRSRQHCRRSAEPVVDSTRMRPGCGSSNRYFMVGTEPVAIARRGGEEGEGGRWGWRRDET